MSPVWSMSPVHSSALELPLRHSMERTLGSRVGESELLCDARSMVMFNTLLLFLLRPELISHRVFGLSVWLCCGSVCGGLS